MLNSAFILFPGWIDRCFAENVCFDTVANKWFDNGMLKDKKLLLSMTTGGSAGFFSSTGVFGDMNVILWPIQVGCELRLPLLFKDLSNK